MDAIQKVTDSNTVYTDNTPDTTIMSLLEYRTYIEQKIRNYVTANGGNAAGVTIDISDQLLAKMQQDPALEDEVLNKIRAQSVMNIGEASVVVSYVDNSQVPGSVTKQIVTIKRKKSDIEAARRKKRNEEQKMKKHLREMRLKEKRLEKEERHKKIVKKQLKKEKMEESQKRKEEYETELKRQADKRNIQEKLNRLMHVKTNTDEMNRILKRMLAELDWKNYN